MSNLVIVESPTKAKTIGKYLGPEYKVKASMGHLRDLPKSKMGIDIEGGFVPDYQPIKGKEEMIKELTELAKKSDKVYLATDPDREGEAISWHLKVLLNLPDEKALRVGFNEITKDVVINNIKNPRPIDMNMVDAQQARRALDRIVGYKISPLLWKKIRKGLSAGRVQSVCTRLIVDRENEIKAFVAQEYWKLTAMLKTLTGKKPFSALLFGDVNGKIELNSEAETTLVEEKIKNGKFIVRDVKTSEKKKSPAPPFTTSTLQQEASRRLNMTPVRTMQIAQQLYEGVEVLDKGSIGLISYMRTDSIRISTEAINSVRGFIKQNYGANYCPNSPRTFKSKNNSQDAHEAIRPTNVYLTPESIKSNLTSEQYRLYKLIWSRFVACQMQNMIYDAVSVDIENSGYIFKAVSSKVKFEGFTAIYEEKNEDSSNEKTQRLPELSVGEELKLHDMEKTQNFTQPPSRYTYASIVETMEELGIGRPSTYAPTVATIIDREYVVKEGKVLKPTPLGEVVNSLMKDKFKDIVNVKFTAQMENSLDDISRGEKEWKEMMSEFYSKFEVELSQAEADLKDKRLKVPDEETEEICELCGKKMVIKTGRFGKFLACPGFPACRNTKQLTETVAGECPKCGSKILKRKSKNGYTYYGCEKGADCGFMTWDVPTKDHCPECGKTMFKKQGRGYLKPFCTNESCAKFVPEDQRGYKKKTENKTEKKGKTK